MIIENRSIKYNHIYKKIYTLWHSMMQRCYYENGENYKKYGAIGVIVAEEWHSLDRFIETIDLVDGFNIDGIMIGKLQLDKDVKIMGNKTYSKENCLFISPSDNSGNRPSDYRPFMAINTSRNITIEVVNREKFCRENELDQSTVWCMCQKNSGSPTYSTNKRVSNFYKGWQFFYKEDYSEKSVKTKRVIAGISPEGDVHEFTNMSKFAKENCLNNALISACLAGRQNSTKGWTFKIIKEGIS